LTANLPILRRLDGGAPDANGPTIARRALLQLVLAAAAGGVAAAPGLAAAEPAVAATVKIDNFTFSPADLTVAQGTTVTWVNGDDIPHTVVATSGAFRSRALDTEDMFSFTFARAGEFDYFCSLHPHMTGRILVKAMTG